MSRAKAIQTSMRHCLVLIKLTKKTLVDICGNKDNGVSDVFVLLIIVGNHYLVCKVGRVAPAPPSNMTKQNCGIVAQHDTQTL